MARKKTPSEGQTGREGGSLFDQFRRHSQKTGLSEPKLNRTGQALVESCAALNLGIDKEAVASIAKHLVKHMSDRKAIPDLLHGFTWHELPEGLQFGFSSYLPLSYRFIGEEGKLGFCPDLLGYRADIFDTTGQDFDHREMYFSDRSPMALLNVLMTPPISYTHIPRNRTVSASDLTRLWEFFDGWPIVGFGVMGALERLLDVTKAVAGEDEWSERKRVLDETGRIVDLSSLVVRLCPDMAQANLDGLIRGLSLTPPQANLAGYSLCTAELFNCLLQAGYNDGCFTDYASLIQYLMRPQLLPICPIGRYQGRAWKDVPLSLVNYYLRQDWIHELRYRDLLHTLNRLDEAKALYVKEKSE